MAASNEYGKALFMLTEECGTTDTAIADISAANEIFKQNPDYIKLLDTPAITKAEKLALAEEAFRTLDGNLKNLIKLLCERHSVYTFGQVYDTYLALYNESRGIESVEAVTAVSMTDEQISRMTEKLSSMTGKRIIIKYQACSQHLCLIIDL